MYIILTFCVLSLEICIPCTQLHYRYKVRVKDHKSDGGGEKGQFTLLRAPCMFLLRPTYCSVTLQEQDHSGKLGNSHAPCLTKTFH